ncbi:MAG TPA: S41 family peptidase [Steroidobacteraceae bacterium]|nr:S41 family peptidase [Steroidobacteraceae bacterium]
MKRRLFLAAAIAGLCSSVFGQGADARFSEVARAINAKIRANHYRRTELDSEAYRRIEQDVVALGEQATSAEEFIARFNALWREGPFSHVSLGRAEESTAQRYARLDTELGGPEAVNLTWREDIAILAVNTMSGVDTIEAINAAYDQIVSRKAAKLIIDLRSNGGGAFAVVPLIGHLIDKPIDAGVFVVGSWYADHRTPPAPGDFASAKPWRGYSVRAFQADVLTRPLTSYRIDPLLPHFGGPVFVLTSRRSISAAEIAADALKSSGRAKIVGEKTPGAVLSSRLFDIPGGFHLRVPIADYYSITGARLEGTGVTPDVAVSADQALDFALAD